ncbi:PREDICTED: probable thionin-2.4 [Camelina sativa]|uniref:Probable thionin-2.4 n=1 Tax=Camelina sativa TaxID=90675 RepID=A0ABM0U4Q3_CAMSA|nr:PREDICTED: probable thionin-2.4 [Camelina sativa]
MEGKNIILGVLLVSLVMAQIYNTSRLAKGSSGCDIVNGKCPNGCTKDVLENAGDNVNEYCKIGCVSSVCIALTTLETSDASEIMNEHFEKCALGCSKVCTKGSMNVVETD